MSKNSMDVRVPTTSEAKKFRQQARDEYISCGHKVTKNDFRVVTIVWVCPKGCTHPSHYAFHKNIKSMRQLADEYHIDFEDRRIGDDLTERVDGYRFSDTNWRLLKEDDAAPSNGTILVINHVLAGGIWYVNHNGPSKEQKCCFWCFKPGAKEKCSWCVEDSLKNPNHVVARYCNRECQLAHLPAHKTKKARTKQGEQICAQCSKQPITSSCGKCGKAFYCSKDCQTAHWSKHKLECNDQIK